MSRILLKDLLLEKIFKLSKDVDFVYKTGGFKKFIDELKKGNLLHKDTLFMRDIIFEVLDSQQLKTIDAKKAHLVNPVKIKCGVFKDGSYYRPDTHDISLSFHQQVLYLIAKGTADRVIMDSDRKFFESEITENRMRYTIGHELSHWVSDSLYNNHIGNVLHKAQDLNNADVIKLHKKDVSMTYFEIDAQVHGIKELKRKKSKKEWNTMTLTDLFVQLPSFHRVTRNLDSYGQDVYEIWQKSLMKRMSREGLLGQNMRSFVNAKTLLGIKS